MEGYYNFQRPTLANNDDQMKATGMSPSEVLEKRLAWDRMRMAPTDIADITGATYTYLMNGKAAHENPTFVARPGYRVRLRIVNASTMTFYDIRIPGLPMTVVQADGQNIKPVETDEPRIGVAETYDVIVTLPDARAYTLFAETMDGMDGMDDENHAGMGHEMPHRAPGHGHGTELPTTNLVERIEHGPRPARPGQHHHGPNGISPTRLSRRRTRKRRLACADLQPVAGAGRTL